MRSGIGLPAGLATLLMALVAVGAILLSGVSGRRRSETVQSGKNYMSRGDVPVTTGTLNDRVAEVRALADAKGFSSSPERIWRCWR